MLHIFVRSFSDGFDFGNFLPTYFPPKNAARSTVPGGPSVACSTAKAVEWDAAWSKNPDPSGRAALGVHDAAYQEAPETTLATENSSSVDGHLQKLQDAMVEATATATAL